MASSSDSDASPRDTASPATPALPRIVRWISRLCQTSQYATLADGIQRRLFVVLVGKASNVMVVALAALIVCATCFERGGPTSITVLSGVNVVLLVARSGLVVWFRTKEAGRAGGGPIDVWLALFSVSAVASSICWGASTCLSLAISHDPVLYVFSLVCTVATAGAVAARNSAFPRVAIAQLLFSLMPIAVGCFFADEHAYALMSILAVGMTYGLVLVVEDTHKQLVDLFITQDMLRSLTYVDQLTSANNRRCFNELMDSSFSEPRRGAGAIGVLMIDVDFFKAFNDRYGHPEGDRCLKEVAAILARHLRPHGDTLCRYGGEEFVVVVEGMGGPEIGRMAERLRSAVHAAALPHDGRDDGIAVVTVSVGAASTSDRSSGPEAVLASADIGLYEAKRLGRNRAHLSV